MGNSRREVAAHLVARGNLLGYGGARDMAIERLEPVDDSSECTNQVLAKPANEEGARE
jgi:hypothetical protein